MSRVAFFGLVNAMNFRHVGGMDSLVRRLALSLADAGTRVDLVHYGAAEKATDRVHEGVEQKFFTGFREAASYLADTCRHVVSVYLRPRDRVAFAGFRKRLGDSLRFHSLYASWNESRLKRELLFAEGRLWPFNGYIFCISPRLQQYAAQWAPRCALLLPPVPRSYFHQCRDKARNGRISVTYAGRIDPGKGVIEAVDVFRRLAGVAEVEACICGFAWSDEADAVSLHEQLLADKNIKYEAVDYRNWSPQVERFLMQSLRETDVLLLPYRRLSSTVDMPLLLLEGMASLCAVVTPPLGDLHTIYGPSPFSLGAAWNVDTVVGVIQKARRHLEAERQRLFEHNSRLQFDLDSVSLRFRRLLDECA